MRAIVIESGSLALRERPEPEPGPGELLVRVEAAGLNGADLQQRAGRYPAPPGVPGDIPGLECAGTVEAVGSGEVRHQPGDRVMAIVAGGAQAELCVVPDAVAMDVPDRLGWAEAGGFAEVFMTAHDALITQCALAEGERLLVTGGAGGVGMAAVQLGRLRGADVVASVRRGELREAVSHLGAGAVIDPAEEGDHGPYDVVMELVGAAGLGTHLAALNTKGRIVFIGVGAGATTELDARMVMSKRAVVRGSTLRARPLEDKQQATEALVRDAMAALAGGDVVVHVAATYRFEEVEEAYERFAGGGKFGKIVLMRAA